MLSLPDVLEVPPSTLVVITGAPGTGKSAFFTRVVAHQLFDIKKPVVMVSTKSPLGQMKRELERIERVAARTMESSPLRLIDAYSATVGLHRQRENLLEATCNDLTSVGIALGIALREFAGQEALVAIESLTPLYLLNDKTFIKFVQNTLLRYAGEKRKVISTIDEGCGRSEDLTALYAIAPAVLRTYIDGSNRVLEVVKYPGMASGKLVVGATDRQRTPLRCRTELVQDTKTLGSHWDSRTRPTMGDFIGISWLQLVFLGGLMWDYSRFPRLIYEVSRDVYAHCVHFSRTMRADKGETNELDAILQQSIHDPRVAQPFWAHVATEDESKNWGLVDFNLEGSSKGRHVVEYRESAISWNMSRLGAKICFFNSGALTSIKGYDNDGCQWEVYEEKCLAAGDPCCRFIVSTTPTQALDEYLDSAHSEECEDVFNGLIQTIADVGLKGFAPTGRPKLGSETHLNFFQEATSVPALSNEKFMLAMRLAGANVGTRLAEKYLEVGVKETKARMALSTLFTTLKIGRLSVGDTIKLHENCESYGIRINEPICFFTTGFLNGFFRTIEGFNVKELRCVGAGDQICEWEFS